MDKETKAIEEAKSRGKNFIENGWTEHEVEIFVKGFVEGLDWSIETAYHQPGDIPEENEMILCETKNGPMIAGPFHKDFNETVELFGIKRWAYTKDFMPVAVPSPEKKEVNSKYSIGQSVIIKSEGELRLLYGKDAYLTDLIPYVNQEARIEDVIVIDDSIKYMIRRYMMKGIIVGEDAIKEPVPEYKKGQSVVIKSESDLHEIYYGNSILTYLLPFAGKVVQIIGTIPSGDPAYTLYRIENEESNITLDITYNAILCDANDRPQREPLECRNQIDSIIARDIHVAQLDTSKLNSSPMQIWNEMFSGTKGFLSSASPELRAFAAGQLLELSEMIMKEMTDGTQKGE